MDSDKVVLGKKTFFDSNSAGQTTLIIDPVGNRTEFTYELGDLVAVKDPVGNITKRFVDTAGRVLRVTAPQGEVTRYAYDQLNRLKEITDPLDGETTFAYDLNSNLRFVTDARGGKTEYRYDNMDRLQTRIDPLGPIDPQHRHQEDYAYDCNGNLTNFTDRKGQPTATTYDPLNRPKLVTSADASTKLYTWDKGNRLTLAQASDDGSLMCGYDPLDYLETETTPRGTVSYTHDTDGRRLTLNATGQSPASYTYDNADQLQTVSLYGLLADYDYDDAGKRTRLTLPNGVKVEYGYDAASRITGLTYKLGTTVLGNLTYEYDKNRQRIKMGGSFARTTLPAPVSSATYDLANRVETFDGFPVEDDENGNITELDGDTYEWNVRDQLVGITGPGLSATFGYDALGRRSKKTVNGQTTEYLSDGINPLQEQAVPGGPWTGLTMTGLGVDEIIARGDASGTYYFLPDGLGSTVALMDGAGSIHTEYTYAPFGETTRTGTVATNPFQFTGRENDNTGLYYYRNRYYHPVLQRFISEDPIEFAGGDVNLYGYVRNNPLNLRDPFGLATLQLGLIVNVQAGSFAFNYAGGIIIDDRGDIGIYNTPGFATGAGFSASIGVQVQTSNAATIKDVEGPFVTYSATGGEIVNGTVDAFGGPSDHGIVLGGGATAGVGFGLGCSIGATTTTVTPLSGHVDDPSNPSGEVKLQMPQGICRPSLRGTTGSERSFCK